MAKILFLLVCLGTMLGPGTVAAEPVEYRIWPLHETTPNHVYAIWQNMNAFLLAVSIEAIRNKHMRVELKHLGAEQISGAKPRDVLRRLQVVKERLNAARDRVGLPDLSRTNVGTRQNVTPATVFQNSLIAFSGLIEWLDQAGIQTDPAPFLSFELPKGKTPSDAYGLVDLADKRLKRLIPCVHDPETC